MPIAIIVHSRDMPGFRKSGHIWYKGYANIHRVHSLKQPSDCEPGDDESTDPFQDQLNDNPLCFVESVRDNSRGTPMVIISYINVSLHLYFRPYCQSQNI